MSDLQTSEHELDEKVEQLDPGARLREAREARHLSLADVALRLRLDAGKIQALEQGDVECFAAPVFFAGYLRNYVRLLELPENEVLADYTGLIPSAESMEEQALTLSDEASGDLVQQASVMFALREVSRKLPMLLFGGLALLLLALVYFLVGTGNGKQGDAGPVKTTDVPLHSGLSPSPAIDSATDALAVTTTAALPAGELPAVNVVDEDSPAPLNAGDTAAVTSLSGAAGVEDSGDAVAVNEVVENTTELTLVFNEASWVDVRDARDQRLLYRLAKAGATHTLTGVAPFTVQLGYVPGVTILLNGAPYDLSAYAGRRSVRLRIADSDAGANRP